MQWDNKNLPESFWRGERCLVVITCDSLATAKLVEGALLRAISGKW